MTEAVHVSSYAWVHRPPPLRHYRKHTAIKIQYIEEYSWSVWVWPCALHTAVTVPGQEAFPRAGRAAGAT